MPKPKKNNEKNDYYQVESQTEKNKPEPIAEQTYFVFNDMKKGQVKHGHFTYH